MCTDSRDGCCNRQNHSPAAGETGRVRGAAAIARMCRLPGVALLGLLVLGVAAPPAFAQSYLCEKDKQGPNDEPGQKDLTRACVAAGAGNFELFTVWDWDLTTLSGSNTGDACSLYDNDGDGYVNLAVCVTIRDHGNPVSLGAVRLFTCNDTRLEGCAGPVMIEGNKCVGGEHAGDPCLNESDCVGTTNGVCAPGAGKNTSCTVTVKAVDPFPEGEDSPNDAVASCSIDLNDFGLDGSITLLDACSYPSDQPNSDYSDCILRDIKGCDTDADCNDSNVCSLESCVKDSTTGKGFCSYTPAGPSITCGSDSDTVCDNPDACSSLAPMCSPNNEPATKECRAAAGTCDVAESCDGAGSCPADGFAAGNVVCRGSAGTCDAAEHCTGASAACPADGFASAGTACGSNSDTACDNPDTCNGSGVCQPNHEGTSKACGDAGAECTNQDYCDGAGSCADKGYKAAGTACGSNSDTACDNPDTCNGSGVCQPNYESMSKTCGDTGTQCTNQDYCDGAGSCADKGYKAAGTACGGSGVGCDALDTCDDAGKCVDNVDASTVLCREASGQCDVPEYCNGTTKTCPADRFEPSTTVCTGTSNGGVCDATDHCSGTADTCVDGFKPSTQVCRADDGQCDVAETCTGSSGACPADRFEPSTTVCTGTSNDGACDGTDRCSGTANTCVDKYQPTSYVCRGAAGPCDVAETCTGSSAECPADAVKQNGAVCRADAGECDVTDYCDGASKECEDTFEPEFTSCGDDADNECTAPDTCSPDGVCLPRNKKQCSYVTDSNLCTFDVDSVLAGRQFNVILTPDAQIWPGYKLNATNPGQFYYNAIAFGNAGDPGTVTFTIPWPFITQGARPVHVYDAETIDIDTNYCFRETSGALPINGYEAFPATITFENWKGTPNVGQGSLGDVYSVYCDPAVGLPNGKDYTCTVTVNFHYPASGKAYVNIHLDYGVKGAGLDVNPAGDGADRYDAGSTFCTGVTNYLDALQNTNVTPPAGSVALASCTPYPFSNSGDSDGSDAVQNVNTFKKISGVFGQLYNSDTGELYPDVPVTLKLNGIVVASGKTDADGYYVLPYKHTGKAATFTVTIGSLTPQNVILKANGWAQVSYDVYLGQWVIDVSGK